MAITIFEFSQAINKLNKDKNYGGSLSYFKENKAQFSDEQISGNNFIVSAMLNALRQTGNYDSAFKFMEHYKITISETTSENVLNAYGWLLYSKFKAENLHLDNQPQETDFFDDDEIPVEVENLHFNKSEIIQKIEELFPLLLKINNDYSYTVLSNLFNSVLKAEKKKPNANWKFVIEFCDLLTPDQLKTDCHTMEVVRKGEKKPMELASDRENWYAYRSKALMKIGSYQECYDLSKIALDAFEKFHYSNDVWFARRIALSKKHLGNSEDAIKELLQVLKRKKEWFIQKELAELYNESGDTESAFNYAIQAINNFGDLEYKVDLLFLIGELLKAKQENELAFKHYSLSRLVRLSEEWKVPVKLQSALSQFGKENIPVEKLPELKSELKKFWKSFSTPQQNSKSNNQNPAQKQVGRIDKILHNDEKGADGFIKYNGNKSVYFRVFADDAIVKKLTVGLEVEFKILPATNDKKEKAIQLKHNG